MKTQVGLQSLGWGKCEVTTQRTKARLVPASAGEGHAQTKSTCNYFNHRMNCVSATKTFGPTEVTKCLWHQQTIGTGQGRVSDVLSFCSC